MALPAVPSINVIPTALAGSTGRSSNPSNDCSIHSTLSSFVSAPMFNKLGLIGKITGNSSDEKETWRQWGARNLGALGGWTMHQLVCAGVSRQLGELAGTLAMEKAKENPLVAVGLGACVTAGYALRGAKALYRLATETKEESDYLNAIELGSTDPTKFKPEELAAAGRRRKFVLGTAVAVNLAAGAGLTYLGYERHLDASRGVFLETVANLVTRSHVYAIFRDGLQGMFGLVDGGNLPPTQAETRRPAAIYAFEQILGGIAMDYASTAITNPLYKVVARSAINAFIEALDNFQLSVVTGGNAAKESDKGIQELQHWNLTAGLTKNIFHKLFDQSITREALLHVVNASFVGIAMLSEMNDKTKSPEAGVNLLQSLFINTLGAGVIGLLYGPIVSTWFWQGTQRNLDPETLKRTMEDLEKGSAGTASGSATPPEELQGVTVDTNQSAGTQAGGGTPADALVGTVRPGEMTLQQVRDWNMRREEQRLQSSRPLQSSLRLSDTVEKLTQALQHLSAKSDSDTRREMPNPDDEGDINKLFAAGKALEERLQRFASAKAGGDTGAGMQNPLDAENEIELLAEAEKIAEMIQGFLVDDAFFNPNASPLDVTRLDRAGTPMSNLDLNDPTGSRANSDADITDNRSEVSNEGDEPDVREMANVVSALLDGSSEIALPPVGSASDEHASDIEEREGEEDAAGPSLETGDGYSVDAASVEDEQAITDAETHDVSNASLPTDSDGVATSITSETESTPTPPPVDAPEPEATSVTGSANEEDSASDVEPELPMFEVFDDSDAESDIGDGDTSDTEEWEGEEDADGLWLDMGDGHSVDAESVEDEQAITDAETRDVGNASLPTDSADVATSITSETESTSNLPLTAEPQTAAPMAETTKPLEWNGNPISARVYSEYTSETTQPLEWNGNPISARVYSEYTSETEPDAENRAGAEDATAVQPEDGVVLADTPIAALVIEEPVQTSAMNESEEEIAAPAPAASGSMPASTVANNSAGAAGAQGGSDVLGQPKRKFLSLQNLIKKTPPPATSNTGKVNAEDDRRGKGNKLTRFFKKVPNPFKKTKEVSTDLSQSAQDPASSASPTVNQPPTRSRKGKERVKN